MKREMIKTLDTIYGIQKNKFDFLFATGSFLIAGLTTVKKRIKPIKPNPRGKAEETLLMSLIF